MYDFFSGVL